MNKVCGKHVIVDYKNIDPVLLRDCGYFDNLLQLAASKAGATILHSHFHSFGEEHGCTGVIVLSESHISIHTWPEYGLATVDIYMCGDCNPEISHFFIVQRLEEDGQDVKIDNYSCLERGKLNNC